MSVCRFCLDNKIRKDITELKDSKHDDNKSYTEIILFCIGTQVEEDSKVSTKLCLKCFKKTIEFFGFKKMALENESYLKSVSVKTHSTQLKNEIPSSKIKTEIETVDINDSIDNGFESDARYDEVEIVIKDEPKAEEGSDDELLSVIKKIKYEFIEENAPIKKKRVRTKKIKPLKIKVPKTKQDMKLGPMKVCEECGKCVRDIKAHMITHLPLEQRRRVKCEICDKIFASAQSKYKHKKRKHFGTKKECPICHKVVLHLSMHLKIHNPDELKFKCTPCGRQFVSKSLLEAHLSIHTKDKPYECDICLTKFRLRSNMLMHNTNFHVDFKLVTISPTVVKHLGTHSKMHNPEEHKYECAPCGRRFISKARLELHVSVHTKDKPYECEVCQAKFRLKISMVMHKRQVHDKEKSHLCQYCSKSFFKKYHLQIHLRSHTKEKPYSCPTCGKCFMSRTILRNHFMIHSDKKTHACKLCDMSFVRLGYLNAHMLSHTKEKRFPCQYCGVRFHRSDHRKRHEFTAHLKHSSHTPTPA